MSDDVIIVVPRGTRVRYVEAPVESMYAIDANQFPKVEIESPPFKLAEALFGLPVFAADKLT